MRAAAELDEDRRIRIIRGYVSALVFRPPLSGTEAAAAVAAVSEMSGVDVRGADFVKVPRKDMMYATPQWSVPILSQQG
mgnify:CR=1 FL=1